MMNFSTLITLRGLATFILAVYLLVGPGVGQSDIVAQMFGISVVCIAGITFLLFVYNFLKVRRTLRLDFNPESSQNLYAGENIKVFIGISRVHILPLFEVRIDLKFRDSDLKLNSILIDRNLKENTKQVFEWKFPHRGIWQAEHLLITFRDRIGFFEIKRKFDNFTFPAVHILPARSIIKSIPTIVSSYAPGDVLPVQNLPQGDYYEIKKYQPADGSKRIIWKVFARTGELVSRHPEETVSPEGKTVLFVLANKDGDDAANAALNYAAHLESHNIELIASCAGNSKLAAFNRKGFAELMMESVWNSSINPQRDLDLLLEEASKLMRIENLVIFCQSSLDSATKLKFEQCLKIATGYNTSCVICRPAKLNQAKQSLLKRAFIQQEKKPTKESAYGLLRSLKLNIIEC
jgi:hypothetical protein